MQNKYNKLKIETQTAVEIFSQEILLCENFEEVKKITDELLSLVYVYAPKKNNRPSKSLSVWQKYLSNKNLEENRAKKIKKEINNTTKKTYKNYLDQIYLMREKGYSNQKIADELFNLYSIKVSRETIRKVVNYV